MTKYRFELFPDEKIDVLTKENQSLLKEIDRLLMVNKEAADKIDELLKKCRELEEKWANEDKRSI